MNELKATTAQEIVRNEKDCDYMDELFGGVKMPPTQVYLKSEADKVIAHNKYKRCLAMAEWCRMHDEFTQLESERLGLPQRTLFLEYRRKAMWWNKWHNRWLELAEKFKEAK